MQCTFGWKKGELPGLGRIGMDSVEEERTGTGGGAVRGGTTGKAPREGRRDTSGVEPRLESELTSAGAVRGS